MFVDDVSLEICTGEPPTATPTATATSTPTATPTNTPTSTPTATPQIYTFFDPAVFNDHPLGISGRIVDTLAQPLAGVTVRTDKGQSTVSNANGVWGISNLAPGTYIITAQKTDYQFLPLLRQVTIPPSAFEQDFTAIPPTPTPDPYP